MKHYRILESKIDKEKKEKQYKIQYLKKIFFFLYFWKTVSPTYLKYEDAFAEVKKLIVKEDYYNDDFGYHYIDAYKIFKTKDVKQIVKEIVKDVKELKDVPDLKELAKEVKIAVAAKPSVASKPAFVPQPVFLSKDSTTNRSEVVKNTAKKDGQTNQSSFVPKQ